MLPGNYTSQNSQSTVSGIYYVGMGTVTGTDVSTITSITYPYPSGIQAGDILVLIDHEDDNGSHCTWPPSGWTNLYTPSTSGGFWIRAAYKVHTTGTSMSLVGPGSALDHSFGTVIAFRGVNTSSPLAATTLNDFTRSTGGGNPFSFTNVTTTVDKAYVCNIIGHDIDTSTASVTFTANTSLSATSRGELLDISTQLGWNGGFGVYGGIKDTAGVVNNCAGSIKADSYKRMIAFALKPA